MKRGGSPAIVPTHLHAIHNTTRITQEPVLFVVSIAKINTAAMLVDEKAAKEVRGHLTNSRTIRYFGVFAKGR